MVLKMNSVKSKSSLRMPCFVDAWHDRCASPDLIAKITDLFLADNYYGLDIASPWFGKVLAAYQQPHRYFHTLEHLLSVC